MSSEDAATLANRRRAGKSAITRHIRTLARAVTEEDVKEVTDRLSKMKESFANFEEVHNQYHETLTDEAAIASSDAWFEEVDQNYMESVKDARYWLKSISGPPFSASPFQPVPVILPPAPSVPSVNTSDIVSALNIPKVEIDVFSGNPLEYQSFMAIFQESVGNRVNDDNMKLTRLLQYTAGPAKAAIRNCALIGGSDGYQQACAILKNRFGSDHLISQKVIADLKSGKSVANAHDLQQLADDLTMAASVLTSINMTNEIGGQQSLLDILQRCPTYIRNKWKDKALDHKRDKGSYPTFKDFVAFINKWASDWGDPVYGRQAGSTKSQSMVNTFTSDAQSTSHVNVGRTDKCVLCGPGHRLLNCAKFKSMHPWQRVNVAREHSLCFNCLLPNHTSRICKKASVCSVPGCGLKHTKFLHMDKRSGQTSQAASAALSSGNAGNVPGSADNVGTGNGNASSRNSSGGNASNEVKVGSFSVSAFGSAVYLPIVPVIVNGAHVTALLDTGSTNTFMSEHLANRLGLEGTQHDYIMSTVSNRNASVSSKCVSVNVSSTDGTFCQQLSNVLVVPSIPAKYPGVNVDISQYPHLSDITLPLIKPGQHVDLLIGMDNSNLLFPLEFRRSPISPKLPFATRSVFGWCLNGSIQCAVVPEVQVHFTQLESKLESLWHIETHDFDDKTYSVDDEKVLALWDRDIYRDNDGHYVLPIPWKDGRPNLPNNKIVAQHRLNSLTARLSKTDMTEKYDQNIKEMVDSGYAEKVPDNELTINDGTVWYLPHHPVVSASKPGKVRPVFDCAAKFHGVSLNNQCYQGPDLTNKLINVLLQFRQYQYAVTADIRAMYLQIRIPDYDRNALRFLWFSDGLLTEFRMTSHLFGGVWCASSSTYALRRTVQDTEPSALVSDTIMRSFYVDDMLRSVRSREEAIEVVEGTQEVLNSGGFRLTKFIVNDQDVLNRIDLEDRAEQVVDIVPDTFSRALGVRWDVFRDSFQYVSKVRSDDVPVTRRRMLSEVSSMYDPLGLISPIVIKGKMIFQEATKLKLSWDHSVPPVISGKWLSWLHSLRGLEGLWFNRCVLPEEFYGGVSEMHHFADASSLGYGACSYIRTINSSGKIHVALVAAKGRVAPLKSISIPRLELSAATTAVKLDQLISSVFDIEFIQSHFWSDSEIVLAYIRNDSRRFKVFVANRVSQIRSHSAPNQWHHIPGSLNPADVVSRGCDAGDLPLNWMKGPDFLSQHKCDWPKMSSLEASDDCLAGDVEIKESPVVSASHILSDVVHPLTTLAEHYSSFYRMQKAFCWILRFASFIKDRKVIKGPITCSELQQAEKLILRHVQHEIYSGEILSLSSDGKVKCSSSLYKLSPMLDHGLLVVGGRLSHASMARRSKSPIIMPYGHKVSYMIVQDMHDKCHVGTEWLLSQLRTKYWIVRARAIIKQVKRKCVTCKRLYADAATQRMADLPPARSRSGGPPFQSVGLDVFGPFYVKVGRSNVKRYGCVFSCFSTRAIHIEKLDGLDTDTFINGFVRFVSRRSGASYVLSDNGTNLVGACNELRRSFSQIDKDRVIQEARRRHIDWQFNPPMSSHMAGLWERMIRTIRRVLCALLGPNSRMNDDVLNTIFCEVENIVNSRPLTKVSDDIDDAAVITPNHFLVLGDNASLPWARTSDSDVLRRRWRHVQHVVGHFWQRWIKEYLPELNRRQKWLDVKPNLRVGDVVLITDENAPRGSWPLGRVVEVHPGSDGLVRSARLKTQTTALTRPITKLVFLEGVHY